MADDEAATLRARIMQLEGAIRLAADKSMQLESIAAKVTEMLHEMRADVRRLGAENAALKQARAKTTYYVPERQPGSPCLHCGSPSSGHGFAGNCPGT